jgi:UPF0755 protein
MRRLWLVPVVLVAGGAAFFLALLSPVQRSHPYTSAFVVEPGESLSEIALTLQSVGLVRDRRAFAALAVLRGKAKDLKAGPYRGSSDEWAWKLVDRLAAGDVEDTSVTIPEGLWMAEIAQRMGPWVAGGADSFLAAATDSDFVRSLGVPGPTAEGYLFPDTYRVVPGSPARAAVREMVEQFFRVWREQLAARARTVPLTMNEVVTLASVVEAEARVAAERPRIAAVYLNRLHRGLPLQADPTVIYALGERRSRILLEDLDNPSPYNTYRRPGLPPGPIGSPGLGSLRAVLWPTPGSRELYFVARGDGTHLFARDFAEHRRNRKRAEEFRRREARRAPEAP